MNRSFSALFIFFSLVKNNSGSGLCDYFENTAVNVSEPCLKQMRTVCNNPKLGWMFFDASSRFLIPGMTYSNVIDYGNFPECLSINYEDQNGKILGKFCGLSHIIANILLTPQSEKILTRFGLEPNASVPQIVPQQDFSKLERELRDVLVPEVDFVLSKYSSCVPDVCTPREVGNFFWYGRILATMMVTIITYTDLTPCETVNSNIDDFEAGDIAVIVFLVIIGVLIIESTIYDVLCRNFKKEPYHPLCTAFSLLKNGKRLLEISSNTTEQIQCFSGMRFFSMMWVIAFHGFSVFQAGIVSLENYPETVAWNNDISNRYIVSALLAVDTFFYIAGFLLAFSYLKRATEEPAIKQIKDIPRSYLHRYLRLTPSVAVMYLILITILRFFGRGPNWSLITKLFKETCKEKWWEFFLYVQNYTDPDGMCVVPTWYLSADMQMFILAPLVMIPVALYVKKSFKKVMLGLGILTVITILIPVIVRYAENDRGSKYTTHERFNNFLIGIAFGTYMRFYKHEPFIFKPIINVIIWAVILIISIAFNLYWFDVDTYYDLTKYTLFMALYRPVWCVFLSYMVYSCYHNQGGLAQWILTRPSFQILGRLSYSMYVLHFMVEIFAGGTSKTTFYFSNYMMFYYFCGHFIVTLAVSVIWVLAFEFPMLTIDKYLINGIYSFCNLLKHLCYKPATWLKSKLN